jgi:uncharacterized protein with HEPN domain
MTQHDPRLALEDMRLYAGYAMTIASGRTRADLDTDISFSLALARAIEVVGEAASRVPAEIRASHPEILWASIVGTRNRLIHAYQRVDHDILWQVVEAELPPLVAAITKILESDTGT